MANFNLEAEESKLRQMTDLEERMFTEICTLRSRLAEVERERDAAFETWKKFHQETLAAFIENEHEPLKSRLADAEALLRDGQFLLGDDPACDDHHRRVKAFLAPDSASAHPCQFCGADIRPNSGGTHREWCPTLHPITTPDQPEPIAK